MDKSHNYDVPMPVKDTESLKQECYGYLKTKQFMAERIFEQQREIEALKNQVFFHSIKHIQMYDWLKFMNDQLKLFSQQKKEKVDQNLNNELENSFIYEIDEFDTTGKKMKSPSPKTLLNNKNLQNENEELTKAINMLKTENVELKKQNEILKIENLEKNLLLNKTKSDKFVLFNELNELVHSIKTIDIKLLNKFYKKYNQDKVFTRNEMPYSMGIKYNIITAQNQLAFLIHSDLIASKSFSESYNKINDTLSEERNKLKNDNNPEKCQAKDSIDIDNYLNVISQFEKDFQRNFDSTSLLDKKSFQF